MTQRSGPGSGKTGGDVRWEYFWHWAQEPVGAGGSGLGAWEGARVSLRLSGYRFFSAH